MIETENADRKQTDTKQILYALNTLKISAVSVDNGADNTAIVASTQKITM